MISLWENAKTLHVHDFWFFGHVHEPQNQLHLTLETPAYSKEFKETQKTCLQIKRSDISKLWNFTIVAKVGLGKSRISINCIFEKSWLWDQSLPEDMKFKFLKMLSMGSISFKNMKLFLKVRNHSTKKTNKPGKFNRVTKTRWSFFHFLRESPPPRNIPTPTLHHPPSWGIVAFLNFALFFLSIWPVNGPIVASNIRCPLRITGLSDEDCVFVAHGARVSDYLWIDKRGPMFWNTKRKKVP